MKKSTRTSKGSSTNKPKRTRTAKILKKTSRAKSSSKKSQSPVLKTPQRSSSGTKDLISELSRIIDITTDEILHNPDVALRWGIKPSRITPQVAAAVRSRQAELDTSIKQKVAKMKGTWNGKPMFLDKEGNPTTINPHRAPELPSKKTNPTIVTSTKPVKKDQVTKKEKAAPAPKEVTKKQVYYDAWRKNKKASADQLRKLVGVPIADKTIQKWLRRWPKGLSIPVVRIRISLKTAEKPKKIKPNKRIKLRKK